VSVSQSALVSYIGAFLLISYADAGVKDEATGGQGPQFAEVFVVIWVGAAIVTLNSQLLGGKM